MYLYLFYHRRPKLKKNPQLEMAKQPQIKRRIQANMSLFHFISLAEQSGHCNRRQAAICLKLGVKGNPLNRNGSEK